MELLAIDPGPVQSAWVAYETEMDRVLAHDYEPNAVILSRCDWGGVRQFVRVIEMIASYGMPVGKEVFETCVWIGRFDHLHLAHLVYRKDVKMHLCGSMRAKDSHIRQALIDMFPATGGGKVPQIGTKKEPGPLYGIKGDEWSALAVAVTWSDLHAA